jgi:ABC-type transport system involved in multi-copper enzyme maturation permease subunit
MAIMSSLVTSGAAWLRRVLPWSNSPQAWQERLGFLVAVFAVVVGGVFVAQLDAKWQTLYWAFALTVVAVLLRRGWLKLFGPVLFYDLICLARRRRYFLVRSAYALFLLFIVCWMWFVWSVQREFVAATGAGETAGFANNIFEAFVTVQFIIVTILTPVYTASAVADEKEHRTLEFLLATDLRNREIVLSKLLSRFLNLGMLMLAGLPIVAFLQFLGGVDPGLVLASYAATLATVASLACLSILFSVLVRKGRDAILLTYLCIVAYFIAYILIFILIKGTPFLGWSWQNWPSTDSWQSPVTLGDLANWFNAGNIIEAVFVRLDYVGFSRSSAVNDALPDVLRDYVIFHGAVALVCATWAVLRLRAIALKEAYSRPQVVRLGQRLIGRPDVGARPMVWKEVFADSGLQLHWFGRILVVLLIAVSFLPLAFIFYYFLFEPYGRSNPTYLPETMNYWARIVGTMVACLLLLGVAVRAAGGISGERDKQTFDSLLTSPLDSNDILMGKWLGSVLSMRRGWLWLAAIYGLAVLTGGVNPVGMMLIPASWLIYAGFVAILGLWFSTTCRTTMRATVWTLLTTVFAFGGHLFFLSCCCAPLLFMMSGPSTQTGELFEHIMKFQLFGLAPPAALVQFAFRAEEFEHSFGSWNPVEHTMMALLGLGIWAAIGVAIWSATSQRLRVLTMRTRFLRPENPERRSFRRDKPREVEIIDVLPIEVVQDQTPDATEP